MDNSTPKDDYGRRLLPQVVDDVARNNPDRIVYSIPITDNPADGFHHITSSRYANAINRTAWWIEDRFGKPASQTFPAIGYIGPNDIRYGNLMFAAAKVGYKMLYLSPRNSIEGHLNVTDKSGCKHWILPTQRIGRVDQVLQRREMKVAEVPELLELLQEVPVTVYAYEKSFAEARTDPLVVLHTSGSTGLPKPIDVTHGNMATADAHHLLPPVEGRLTVTQSFTTTKRAYSTLPFFHAGGINLACVVPFFYELNIILGPPLALPNLDLVNAMLDHADVDGSFLAPSLVEEMSRDPASIARLAKTEFLLTGGGPLSKPCGDKINEVCRLINFLGVTEGSMFPILEPEREDWNYLHYHPAAGFTYQQRTEELWEQFQTRDPALEMYQGFFQTFPEEDEVAVKDLYAKHPTKPGRWLYKGRADDVVVLSNGEKVNPLDMESCLNQHPNVSACLMIGQGKFQIAALVELRGPLPASSEEVQELKESIWEYMQKANHEAPAHGQLHRNCLLFASPTKPFPRAGKGSVQRAMTIQLYADEIEEFYQSWEQGSTEGDVLDLTDLGSIQKSLGTILQRLLPGVSLSATDDFFVVGGLDSLLVFRMLSSLRATLRKAGIEDEVVKAGLIYSNSTIEKLSKAIDGLVRPIANANGVASTSSHMMEILDKYTKDLPVRNIQFERTPSTPCSVILTGSTGSLGSYILEELLLRPHVERVFCLNRTPDAQERQLRTNEDRGLKGNLLSPRVEFLHADLSKRDFGLSTEDYEELRRETTYIIHNQWQVDFNLSLASFEPQIAGVRRLVDFATSSPHNPHVFFTSSVGVLKGHASGSPCLEQIIPDFNGVEGGYACSKLVGEAVLEKACHTSHIHATICRVGQIAGPVDMGGKGEWNKREWLPSIIASSKYSGMLPSTLGSLDTVDWLPVNYVSKIILELAGFSDSDHGGTEAAQPQVFHEVNPNAVSWSTLVPAIIPSLGSDVAVVPWTAWLSALEESEAQDDIERNPALKLLGFYKSLGTGPDDASRFPLLDTTKAQEKSATLRMMKPVQADWMEQWMKHWEF